MWYRRKRRLSVELSVPLTNFLPLGSKLSRSTTLNLGEMFTQLIAPPSADANEGQGTNGQPRGLPFSLDLLHFPNSARPPRLPETFCDHRATPEFGRDTIQRSENRGCKYGTLAHLLNLRCLSPAFLAQQSEG